MQPICNQCIDGRGEVLQIGSQGGLASTYYVKPGCSCDNNKDATNEVQSSLSETQPSVIIVR